VVVVGRVVAVVNCVVVIGRAVVGTTEDDEVEIDDEVEVAPSERLSTRSSVAASTVGTGPWVVDEAS
jgi:hypothetical protein